MITAFLVATTAGSASPGYYLTDIGVMDGGDWALVQAINASGDVVGYGNYDGGQQGSWLFDDGGLHQLPNPASGFGVIAYDLNDSGKVVGTYDEGDTVPRGFFYDGQMASFDPGFPAVPTAVNADGHAAGWSYPNVPPNFDPTQTYTDAWDPNDTLVGQQGFLYRDGTTEVMEPAGGGVASPEAMNSADQVVGTLLLGPAGDVRHAMLYQDETVIDLGTLPGGSASGATDINDDGVVVGESDRSDGHARAFTYDGIGMAALAPLKGDTDSFASAINNDGDIVGDSLGSHGYRAVLYKDGDVFDLNCFLPVTSPWHLTAATGINDAGQIIAEASSRWLEGIFAVRIDPSALPAPELNACMSVPDGQTIGTAVHAGEASAEDAPSGMNTATGAYATSATDMSLPGIGLPFVFARSYNSSDTTVGRLGRGWSDSFDASLFIDTHGNVLLHGEDGQQVSYEKEPDGSYRALAGHSALSKVPEGYQLKRRDQVIYEFTDAGRLTSMSDRNGHGLNFEYGAGGDLTGITDSAGRVIQASHNGDGRLTELELPDGRSLHYGYTAGRLTSFTDAGGGTTTYSYDDAARLATVTDQNGHVSVTNTYDDTGRLTQQADALGQVTTFGWNPDRQVATITDPPGNTWTDTYVGNILVGHADPLGNTTRYAYDKDFNVTTTTDARDNTTTSTYDANYNLIGRVGPAPLSYDETWTYNQRNDPTSHTDGRGETTTYGYDTNGNLTSVTEPGGHTTSYERDPESDLVVSSTNPLDKTTEYAYDTSGNRTSVTTPLGNQTTMAYDASGRLTAQVDPRGNTSGHDPGDYTTSFVYDANDRKISETDPLGHETAWAFDPAGNLTSVTDPNTNTTTYAYDAGNHLTSVRAADAAQTQYTYDENGNMATRMDAKHRVTSYSYDAANRVDTLTSALGLDWTYSYDPNGNKTTTVSPEGTTSYTYDAENRLHAVSYSDDTPTVSYEYDGDNNRTQMVDASGTVTYVHDALNKLTSQTRGSDNFTYEYDAAGNVTRRVYPGGTATDYTYDDDGQAETATSGSTTASYSYDAAGNLTAVARPASNGWNESRIFDRAGRLTRLKDSNGLATLQQLDYTYDAAGNATSRISTSDAEYYEYDNRDRLTKVCYDATCPTSTDTIGWTYDVVDNRLTEVRPAGTTTYSYNAADELTEATGPGGTIAYTYDGDGNETTDGSHTYEYDLAGRIIAATNGTHATEYAYDGNGNRLEATTDGVSTAYVWDTNQPLAQLAIERDGAGTTLRTYIRGVDTIAMLEDSNTYYFHHDRLGSVTAVTSGTGATEWTYTYEPFGVGRSTTKVDPDAPVNHLGYVGQYMAEESGLVDLRARQYDPNSGRFTSTDPMPAGPDSPFESPYDYAGQDPVNSYDLDGQQAITPVHPGFLLGLGLFSLGSACAVNPAACSSGSSIIIKKIADLVRHSEQLPPSKPGEFGGERGGKPFTPSDRNSILNDNGGKCVYCGEPANQADHVIPKSQGGSGTVGNGQPTCEWCNKSKGARYGPRRKPFSAILWPIVLLGSRAFRRGRWRRDRE